MIAAISAGLGVVIGSAAWILGTRAWHSRRPVPPALSFGLEDVELLEWCRHMSLTVITHTGATFSTTLPELARSEAPTFRSWNVPVQVIVWSVLDEEAYASVITTPVTDDVHGQPL